MIDARSIYFELLGMCDLEFESPRVCSLVARWTVRHGDGELNKAMCVATGQGANPAEALANLSTSLAWSVGASAANPTPPERDE